MHGCLSERKGQVTVYGYVVKTHFAMMLPGRAMLSVCDLPPVGVKIAEGFEVSTLPLRPHCCW